MIPESKNFSEYDRAEEDGHFDVNDNSIGEVSMYSIANADMLMYNLLLTLSERQKVAFLYLLMREAGYGLTHEDCAKTLSMKRETYMKLIRIVKNKAGKLLQQSA